MRQIVPQQSLPHHPFFSTMGRSSNHLSLDAIRSRAANAISMLMDIERPLVEKPLVPQQGNDPPEIPHQRFAMGEPFGQLGHVVVAQGPMTEVAVVENPVKHSGEQADAGGAEEEPAPAVRIVSRRHVIEIMVPDEKGDEGETGDLRRMDPEKTLHFRGALGRFQVMEGFGRHPEGNQLAAEQGDAVGSDKGDEHGDDAFPWLGQGDGAPRFHPPDIGRHEQDDDGPFPPAEHPVDMLGAADAAPPRRIEGRAGKEQTKKRRDQHRVAKQGQGGGHADLGQPLVRLFEVRGSYRPFAEKDGEHRVGVETDEHETDHRHLRQFAGGPRLGHLGQFAGQVGGFQAVVAEEVEADAEHAVEEDVDDEPDDDQVDHGLDDAAQGLAEVLEGPVAKKHVLPQTDQDHHGQVHDKGVGKPSDRAARITEDVPGDQGDNGKNK